MEASSERSSSPAGSVGFYQEGPATSDRGEEEGSDADAGTGTGRHYQSGSEEDEDEDEDEEGEDLDSDSEEEEDEHHRNGLIDMEASESGSSSEEENSEDSSGPDNDASDDDGDDDDDDKITRKRHQKHRQRAFIDLEASDDEHGKDHDSDPEYDETSTLTFHPFPRLPLELREKIWDYYNPYLRSRQGRILTCVITDNYHPRIIETQVLSTITQVTNTMLAVHRETRAMAEKFFPHTLESGTELGKIRFDRERDILFLTSMNTGGGESRGPLRRYDVSNIFESVGWFKHLAVDHGSVFPLEEWVEAEHVRGFLGRLETVYLYFESSEVKSKDLRWCWSLPTRGFRVKTEEERAGLGEDAEYLYVWVDGQSEEWDRKRMGRECEGLFDEEEWLEWEEMAGVRILPMVEFAFDEGMRQHEMLEMKWEMGWEAEDVFSDDDEDGEGEGEGEPNEYESEGIDDDTIDEDEGDDDEDDLVVVQDVGSDDDENDSRPPTLDGGSPRVAEDDDDVMEVSAADLPADVLARFSSDEEGPTNKSPASSEDEDEAPVLRTGHAKRSRVVNSDDEEEDEDDRPRKTARRQAPVVISDDEDDDDSEVQEVSSQPVQQTSRRRRQRPAAEESEESSPSPEEGSEEESHNESEDDSEEGERHTSNRPMTLAERLRLFKSDNPVPGEMEVSDHSSDDDDDDDDNDSDRGHEEGSDNGDGYGDMDGDTFEAEWAGDDGDEDEGY